MFGHHERLAAAIVGLTVLAGCTYHPSLFPMYGTADDRSRLAGEWFGEFTSARTGRSGGISFRFDPARDSASGDVSIATLHVGEQTRYHLQAPSPRTSTVTVLRIRYVRAGASTVEGVLEPFHDPDCDCRVTTAFRGVVRGDSIDGEYVSRDGSIIRRGAWRMSRR